MGVVYRALDTKLNRDVALKVLPDIFAGDLDRLMRFEREAQVLASLNHPNIAHIYGFEEAEGARCIAMELVEGDTLRERIKRGPLPVDEALEIARQIAQALDAAHQRGVIHRDLKPGNVKLAPNGTVKVLDFGLAKILQPETYEVVGSDSPTLLMSQTGDVLIGTPAYMSPEQARGLPIDRSTDVWALGCLLYEMLTARQAFGGETMTDVLARIVKDAPDWTALPNKIPARVVWVIRRCLEKNLKERFQSAADIRILLHDLSLDSSQQSVPRRRAWAAIAGVLVACGLLIAAGALAMRAWRLRPFSVRSPVIRLNLTPPAGAFRAEGPTMAFSPDGSLLAYVAGGQLYLHSMNDLEDKALGAAGSYPFFSPDGKSIGFFSPEGKLQKIAVSGGNVLSISEIPTGGFGASWGPGETIYYSPGAISGLSKVLASGGKPQSVTTLDRANGEISHRWPQILPGGKAILFTVWTGPGYAERHVHLHILQTGERRVIAPRGEMGRYLPSGHIVYSQGGRLTAVPFDLASLKVTGTPILLTERVNQGRQGMAFAVSDSGSLAYIPSNPVDLGQLVWVDPTGKTEALPLAPRNFVNPVLSPDGRRAALETWEDVVRIWIYNFARNELTPLTTGEASSQVPVWSPDGKHIAYRATRKGFRNLFRKAVDGSSDEEPLTSSESNETPGSFSSDGKWLAFETNDSTTTNADIWVLPLDGSRKQQAFLQTSSSEQTARFSPDDHWIAYVSNESGRPQVYVRPFPGPGGKVQISTNGGSSPVWSRDGGELFYAGSGNMMAVDVRTQPTFTVGNPRIVFDGRGHPFAPTATGASIFDVAKDGRFLAVERTGPEPVVTQMTVVVNWVEEVKKLESDER
jgi:Tol biopolymer transport system component